jgi:hypothetical protein
MTSFFLFLFLFLFLCLYVFLFFVFLAGKFFGVVFGGDDEEDARREKGKEGMILFLWISTRNPWDTNKLLQISKLEIWKTDAHPVSLAHPTPST